jgi:hypothetical protein
MGPPVRSRALVPSLAGKRTFVRAGNQSASGDNFRAGLVIEAHNGCVCSVEISEDANAAAKADALAHPKLALTSVVHRLVHLVCFPLI